MLTENLLQVDYELSQINQDAESGYFLYGFPELQATDFGAAFVSASELAQGTDFSQVWQQGLLVLFDSAAPTEATAAAALTLVTSAGLDSGIVWVANAANFAAGSPAPSIAAQLGFAIRAGTARVAEFSQIPLGNSLLNLAAGTPVSLQAQGLSFANLSLLAPLLFVTTAAGRRFGTIGPSLASSDYSLASSGVSLSLDAASFGCWQFDLTLEKDTGRNLKTDMELLDAGLHYYSGADAAQALYFPIFDTTSAALGLTASIDSLQPANPARSSFSLPSGALASWFRTRSGNPVTLTPGSDAALLFTPAPAGYTVTPSGSYTMSFVEAAPELLNGLTGTEYLKLSSGAVIYFLPGQPACCEDPSQPGAQLSDTALTAWVSIVPADESEPLEYGLQSPQTLFYQLGEQGTPWNVLEVVEAELAPPSPPATSDYYPLVPFAGVSQRTDSATLMGPSGGLDSKFFQPYQALDPVLLNQRLQIIRATSVSTPSQPGSGTVYGVTPAGLLLQLDNTLTQWQSLILTQGDNTTDANQGQLSFDDIVMDSDFQIALSGQQLFLVMDQTVNTLSDPGFTAPSSMPVEFAGWTFDYAPANWAEHGTIAILKYHPLDLTTLVQNTQYWSWPGAANLSGGSADTQKQLQAIFSQVQRSSDPNFANLQQVLTDPNWQGILYFNLPMLLESIPSDLAMLAGGIDPNLLFAHHVGVGLTSVLGLDDSTNQPLIKTSSAFGLINYTDPSDLETISPYAYKVSSLEVLFLNSVSVNVQASIELVVNSLFGHQATLLSGTQPAKNNLISLSGSAQAHDGQLNLMLSSSQTYTFSLSNSVLDSVTIDTAQFFGLNSPAPDDTDPNPTVLSRFLFTGSLSFVDLTQAGNGFQAEVFDFFSFASLPFQQLRLDVSYPYTQADLMSFSFDPGYLTLVPALSTARPQSLANQLTLKVSSFSSNLMGPSPAALNFIPLVITPFNNANGSASVWYGLICQLPLGSQGSLASDGVLSLEALLAWSPDPTGQSPDQLWFGLRVPGASSSGVFFQIESVIKLGLKQIVLSQGADGGPILSFQDIGLTVLGQSIPPGGQTAITLFGDAGGQSNALAWFADYLKSSK